MVFFTKDAIKNIIKCIILQLVFQNIVNFNWQKLSTGLSQNSNCIFHFLVFLKVNNKARLRKLSFLLSSRSFVPKRCINVRQSKLTVLVLRKGHFNFWKLPLNWILLSAATWKTTSLRYLGYYSLKYLKTIELTHCLNL